MSIGKLFDTETTPKWYIVQTYVGFEDVVKRMIEQKVRNLGLEKKFLEVYIPNKKVTKLNTKGERVERDEKVYPGYIYLHMILDKQSGYLVQNTQYVSKIAGTGDLALPLEDGYVDNIKAGLAKKEEMKKTEVKSTFNMHDLVKVKDGAFKDMAGKICGIDNDKNKVIVLLKIFDRDTEVELDMLEVEMAV